MTQTAQWIKSETQFGKTIDSLGIYCPACLKRRGITIQVTKGVGQ